MFKDLSGDRHHPAVQRLIEPGEDDAGAFPPAKPGSGDDGFQSHAGMRVGGRHLLQQSMATGHVAMSVSQNMHRGRPRLMRRRLKAGPEDIRIDAVLRPRHPERLAEPPLIMGILLVHRVNPRFNRRQDVVRRPAAQLTASAIPRPILRLLQSLQQGWKRRPRNDRWLDQRPRRIRHSENPAMLAIPLRIARIVLHVPNQCIVPVNNVKRPVRSKLAINRPEIGIAG